MLLAFCRNCSCNSAILSSAAWIFELLFAFCRNCSCNSAILSSAAWIFELLFAFCPNCSCNCAILACTFALLLAFCPCNASIVCWATVAVSSKIAFAAVISSTSRCNWAICASNSSFFSSVNPLDRILSNCLCKEPKFVRKELAPWTLDSKSAIVAWSFWCCVSALSFSCWICACKFAIVSFTERCSVFLFVPFCCIFACNAATLLKASAISAFLSSTSRCNRAISASNSSFFSSVNPLDWILFNWSCKDSTSACNAAALAFSFCTFALLLVFFPNCACNASIVCWATVAVSSKIALALLVSSASWCNWAICASNAFLSSSVNPLDCKDPKVVRKELAFWAFCCNSASNLAIVAWSSLVGFFARSLVNSSICASNCAMVSS